MYQLPWTPPPPRPRTLFQSCPGFMTNEGAITWPLLVAVFIANFPESFSAAGLLREQGMAPGRILLMWASGIEAIPWYSSVEFAREF